jgi:hypothetical protein
MVRDYAEEAVILSPHLIRTRPALRLSAPRAGALNRSCPLPAGGKGRTKMEKRKAIIGDFLELGANAFASGLAVAIALALITLALANTAQAATGDDIPEAPAPAASVDEPWSPASMPIAQDRAATDVDALWATARKVGEELPRGNSSLTPVLVGVRGFEPPASTSRT